MSSTNFYVTNESKLRDAIDRTGTSANRIANGGGLSRETLRKALNGDRITRAKAYGIINGLEQFGVKVEFKELFEAYSNNSVTVEIDADATEAERHAAFKNAVEELSERYSISHERALEIVSNKTTSTRSKDKSRTNSSVSELEEDLAD